MVKILILSNEDILKIEEQIENEVREDCIEYPDIDFRATVNMNINAAIHAAIKAHAADRVWLGNSFINMNATWTKGPGFIDYLGMWIEDHCEVV